MPGSNAVTLHALLQKAMGSKLSAQRWAWLHYCLVSSA